MAQSGLSRGEPGRWLTIACCLLAGLAALGLGLVALLEPGSRWSGFHGSSLAGLVAGPILLGLAALELGHRVRHGPQHGRHVREDREG